MDTETRRAALRPDEITDLAGRLRAAEVDRAAIAPLTESMPALSVDDAYRIQLAGIEARVRHGAALIGRKAGLTSAAMQRMLGVDEPDFGHLLDDMVVADGGRIPAANLIQAKVEPEIGFVLGRPLRGPGITPEMVLEATAHVVAALEVIDSRIAGWRIRLGDTIADNASSARVIVGAGRRSPRDLDLGSLLGVMEKNSEKVGEGPGTAVLGHPARAVAWLANTLGARGTTLEAGELILPGAVCAAVAVAAGDDVRATFGPLGSVSVRF
jgi:2-oxopent-4-enoate hydratase